MLTDTLRYPEERRLATVLFADVQGFTSLAEQLDFETVSDLLKGIWERLDKAIESHNGYIDKHLGDGVMGIWGAPFAGDNDAEQAVAAGMDLIKALNEYGENSNIPGANKLKLRVGVNTGLVFAGYVGTRREYTVLGDTVNVANRLEQIAEPGSVVIGENTLRMVRGHFRVKRLEPTMAKGRTELVQAYQVEGRLQASGRAHNQSGDNPLTNMVGRSEELQKLKFYFDSAFRGNKPVMALINGDVGIGKTRLLMEFSNLLEDGEKVSGIFARGIPQASRAPFSLWRILLRNRFGLRDEDSLDEALVKWSKGIEKVWGAGQPELKSQVATALAEAFGLSEQAQPPAEEGLQRIFSLTCELLRRFSAHKRLVLFFDDLQWADRESLQLMAHILGMEEAPLQILIIGVARPEFLKSQSQWHNLAHVINLNPLDLTPDVIGQAYPDLQILSESILLEIGLHAEGNPYFLGEIVKNLLKGGLLEAEIDPQEIRSHLLSQIPEALRATLQARMDNLSREARTVTLLASVVGRVFWVGAVLAAARSSPLPGSAPIINIPARVVDRFIQDGLRQMVRADLAFPRTGSKFSDEQEYSFKNSYLRDVAYSLIPNRNRAQYHKAVAEWLSQMADPAFADMAREHEARAAACAKISTGSLSPIHFEK